MPNPTKSTDTVPERDPRIPAGATGRSIAPASAARWSWVARQLGHTCGQSSVRLEDLTEIGAKELVAMQSKKLPYRAVAIERLRA